MRWSACDLERRSSSPTQAVILVVIRVVYLFVRSVQTMVSFCNKEEVL